MNVRQAMLDDIPQMMEIQAAIIAIGGTTAYLTPFDRVGFLANYLSPPDTICCHVSEDNGNIVGFQSLSVLPGPDQGWADIGTFVAPGLQRRGVGAPLFLATQRAGRAAGVSVINAAIRADNAPGLGYYNRRGFVEYARRPEYALTNGQVVGRVLMRFDIQPE